MEDKLFLQLSWLFNS